MQQNKLKKCAISMVLMLSMVFTAQAADVTSVVPIGQAVGIQMSAKGVLVVKLNDVQMTEGARCPARDAGITEGDVIVKVNGKEVDSNDEMQKQIALSAGQAVEMQVMRDGKIQDLKITPCADNNGVYRIGVMARDNMVGIGTLTYVDPETGAYGSLGHGICDGETGVLMPLKAGSVLYSVVDSVQRGEIGEPGALQGAFTDKVVGTVDQNTKSGIFGTLIEPELYTSIEPMPVASADEIKLGEAEILSNVEGDEVQSYSVQIVKIYPQDDEYGRGMMLRVTDQTLLDKTGGIVQGMSGSPILQNGKIIGAVTHVLVNDPTCGYGIFIENMLDAAA